MMKIVETRLSLVAPFGYEVSDEELKPIIEKLLVEPRYEGIEIYGTYEKNYKNITTEEKKSKGEGSSRKNSIDMPLMHKQINQLKQTTR